MVKFMCIALFKIQIAAKQLYCSKEKNRSKVVHSGFKCFSSHIYDFYFNYKAVMLYYSSVCFFHSVFNIKIVCVTGTAVNKQ